MIDGTVTAILGTGRGILLNATLHSTSMEAHRQIARWRGMPGRRTKVLPRDVRADGVRILAWAAIAWDTRGTR